MAAKKKLPKAQKGATTADSLFIYNNALQQKAYYDKLKPYYKKPEIHTWTFPDTYVKEKEKDHLKYDAPSYWTAQEKAKFNKLKTQIKNNPDPNKSYIVDLITGALDPNAPPLAYDRRITPQGEINYSPKSYTTSMSYYMKASKSDLDYLVKDAKLSKDEIAIFDEIRKTKNNKLALIYDTYGQLTTPEEKNQLYKWAKSRGLSENAMKSLIYKKGLETKQVDALRGFSTDLPYYDPLAVKPANMLTDAEFKKRYEKYGPSGLPQSRITKLGLKSNTTTNTTTNKPNNKTVPKKEEREELLLKTKPAELLPINLGEQEIVLQNYEYKFDKSKKITPPQSREEWKTLPGANTPYRVERPVDPRFSPKYNLSTGSYQSGGEKNDYIEIEADDTEIDKLIDQGYIIEVLPQAQLGLIKSPYQLPVGVKHPMQTSAKKVVKQPTRIYDPLVDNKSQVAESSKPKNVSVADKNVLDKALVQKTNERSTVAAAVKKNPLLTDTQKTEILMNPQKLDENIHLAYQNTPDTVKAFTPTSTSGRAWEYLTNPFTAIEYSISGGGAENMPRNINAMRAAGIDPGVVSGRNLVGNNLNESINLFDAGDKVNRSIKEGDYLSAGLNAMRFLPGSRFATGLGKNINRYAKGQNIYKFLPDDTRVATAGYGKGDPYLHRKKEIYLDDFEDDINKQLSEGLGIKKLPGNLSVKVRRGNTNYAMEEPKFTVDLNYDNKHIGYVGLNKDKNELLNISGAPGPVYYKVSDYPYQFSHKFPSLDFDKSGVSGELNKALTNSLQNFDLGNLYSSLEHSDEGLGRWKHLINKGYASEVDPNRFKLHKYGGNQTGGYIDLDLTPEEIEQYKKGGYIVEELPHAQEGESVTASKTPWTGAAEVTGEETTPPVIYEGKDVTVKAEAPEWARYQKEYETSKPWENFLYDEQRKYLRHNKGLNKAAGISMDDFPQAERIRIKQEYDQKMNDYITRRLGKSQGFNPRRRGEWVDQLTDREKQIVAGSRYGSKLRPNLWSRTLSGARSIFNAVSPVDYVGTLPGYTKAENKETLNNWLEGANVFAPYTEFVGTAPANYLTHTNPRLARPEWYSGELMADVHPALPAVLTPWNYYDLVTGVAAVPQMIRSGVNYGKNLYGAYKLVNELDDPARFSEMESIFGPNYAAAATSGEEAAAQARFLGRENIPAITGTGEIEPVNVASNILPESTSVKTPPVVKPAPTWAPALPQQNTATLKSMQVNSGLFKVVDKKSGMLNINNLKAYLSKADTPASDKALISEIVEAKFPNQKNIPWNELKKAVDEEIGQFEREYVPAPDAYASYGVDALQIGQENYFPEYLRERQITDINDYISRSQRLTTDADKAAKDIDYAINNYFDKDGNLTVEGMNHIHMEQDGRFRLDPVVSGPNSIYPSPVRHNSFHGSIPEIKATLETLKSTAESDSAKHADDIINFEKQLTTIPEGSGSNDTILYHNEEKIGSGSAKHFSRDYVLGHSRVLRRGDEPDSLYFLETQSDWQQNPDKNYLVESNPQEYMYITDQYEGKIADIQKRIDNYKEMLKEDESWLSKDGIKLHIDMNQRELDQVMTEFKNWKKDAAPGTQKQFLRPKMQERLIQEELLTAAKEGKEYILYPTRETAAKIQGYKGFMSNRPDMITRYLSDRNIRLDYIDDYITQTIGSQYKLDRTGIDDIKSLDEFLNIKEIKQAIEKAKADGNNHLKDIMISNAKQIVKINNRIPIHEAALKNITIDKAYSDFKLLKPESPLNKLVKKTTEDVDVINDQDIIDYVYKNQDEFSDKDLDILQATLVDLKQYNQPQGAGQNIKLSDFEETLAERWVYFKKNEEIYMDDHETVLRKYDVKPSLYKKEAGVESVPYTDPEGNTWMKVKVPEKYLKNQGEIRAFKKGGSVDKLRKFIR